MYKIIILYWI